MRTMGRLGSSLLLVAWMLGPAFSRAQELSFEPRADAFVRNADKNLCDEYWTSWPAVQERAIADGTVMVWHMGTSVGNLMRTLMYILPLARMLEVALIINLEQFPAFRVAFEPEAIKWDLDPEPFKLRGKEISKGVDAEDRHALQFLDGFLIVSDHQLEVMSASFGAGSGTHAGIKAGFRKAFKNRWRHYLAMANLDLAPPCAWNMVLRRSPTMMNSMEAHAPWVTAGDSPRTRAHYHAWHIRTSEGETERSFSKQRYIFNNVASESICPMFVSTREASEEACPSRFSGKDSPVYISSNSKSTARNCSAEAGNKNIETAFVDLGIDAQDAHTAFSKNPDTVVNAFIDFLYLMDADIIVCTGSSFSGAITDIKSYRCMDAYLGKLPVSRIYVCVPADC
ncbi:unnamed protein product [Ectocarpus sp. 8 AP-2014]